MNPTLNLWLIPVLPLAGAAINGFLGKKSSRQAVSTVALFFCGASFVLALWVAYRFSSLALPHQEFLAHWIRSGSFNADFAFYLDQLSLVMLLVVTGVGFLIHIYSVGYMWDDPGYYRFFSYLNLFMFFMLTLVLANNYLVMFIGWEGVGLASYLLIGFWFTKDSAASAGKKAFIVNRIGDFGFLIGLFLLIKHFGSLNFEQVFDSVSALAARGRDRGAAYDHRHSAHGGRGGQVGSDPFICLVARCHGRSHTGFGADPRRYHGDGGCVHGLALTCDLRARTDGAGGGRDYRNADGLLCGDDRHRSDGYQESSRLFDGFATWLHVYGLRRRRILGGHFPLDDPRFFQRPAVSGGRLGNPRLRRRAGHAEDGRAAPVRAMDISDDDASPRWPSPEFRRWRAFSAKTRFCGRRSRVSTAVGFYG